MEEYFKYNPKKFKNRNNQSQLTTHKIKYTSYKDNVLQFSLNAINNILINNLNSTINIGMLNITNNNLQKNKNQIMNKNLYINSLNDCIDYKIKGNIYKISQDNFFDLYPNMSDLITNNLSKNKKELKILKFDREMLVPQTKTPTKEVSKHFYFNLMNYNKNNYEEMNNNNLIRNSQKTNSNLEIEQKTKKINNNNNNCPYKTRTTINSKEKNKNITKNINYNRNTYKKKISPVKKYIISKTNVNSKESSIDKQKQNIIKNSKNNSPNSLKKHLVYKPIDNKPRKLIIYTKNKNKDKDKDNEKPKILNSIKNNNIHKYIRTNADLYNKSQSNNSSPKSNNNNKNINLNNIEPPKTERNINYNENNKICLNKANKNRLLLTPNKFINNNPKNKSNAFKNKNLNIPYNPTISNNINRISPKNSSPKNKNNICLQNKLESNYNIDKYANNNYYTINNDIDYDTENKNKSRNVLFKNIDNNIYDKYKTYEVYNDFSKRNNVFNNDNNNIFKILDNTQIITTDDCGSIQSSSMNSNKLHHFSGSNGNNTNQETDYNSLKKFNDLNYDKNNNYKNIGFYESEENFSFNNL
mgnify:CR=1 FL=1